MSTSPDALDDLIASLSSSGAQPPRAPNPVRDKVFQKADEIGVPRDLVNRLVGRESGWSHTDASGRIKRSPKNAMGLFQVVPDRGTLRTVGGRQYDLRDPDQNTEAGLRYLKEGLDKSGGDHRLASLYYFGGPKALAKAQSSGKIPNISDGGSTATDYVKAVGGKGGKSVSQPDPLDELLKSIPAEPPQQPANPATPTVSPAGLQMGADRESVSAVQNPNKISTLSPKPQQNALDQSSVGAAPPTEAHYVPPAPPPGAQPASEFTSKETYDVPLKPFDVERVGALGVIGNAGSEAQQVYLDFVRRNAQPVKGKPVNVDDAAGNEVMAQTFMRLQDYLTQNPNAKPKEQAKAIAQMGMEFLKSPETKGQTLPKLLHQAMLEAQWTPDELKALPGSLRQQIGQRRAQAQAARHAQFSGAEQMRQAKQEMISETFQAMQTAEPETAARELVKVQNATPKEVREYWRNRHQLSAQNFGRGSVQGLSERDFKFHDYLPAATARAAPAAEGGRGEEAIRFSAAMMPELSVMPKAMQDWVGGALAKGTAGLQELTAGIVRSVPRDPFGRDTLVKPTADKIFKVSQEINAGALAMDRKANRSGFSQAAQDVLGGTIASAPAMGLVALGVHPSIAFALQGYLSAKGRDAELGELLTETGKGAVIGALFELPIPKKLDLLARIGSKIGPITETAGRGATRGVVVGGGTYVTERATGATHEQALKNAVVNALFSSGHEGMKIAKGVTKEVAGKVARSEAAPEPVRDISARIAGMKRGVVISEDGRAMSVYGDPKTKGFGGEEISMEKADKYAMRGADEMPVERVSAEQFEQLKDLVKSGPPKSGETITKTITGETEIKSETKRVDETATSPESTSSPEIKPEKTDASDARTIQSETKVAPGIARVPVSQLNVDPERFQYKMNPDASGATGSLSDVDAWNPDLAGTVMVWQDPADGRDYVVNGHNRYNLARRTGQEDVDIRYIKADTAEQARARGALVNIAEGQGTVLDAAKFFRDSSHTPEDLTKQGISLKKNIARDGLALSKLNPFVFNQVVQGELKPEIGALIGEKISSPDLQDQALKAIKAAEVKGNRLDKATVDEMLDSMTSAPRVQETDQTLFGDITSERSLVTERAQVAASLKRQLVADKSLFGTAARQSQRLAEGGTVVDIAKAKELKESAEEASGIFDTLKNRSGLISDILDEGARSVASGKRPDQVAKENYERIKQAVQTVLGRGTGSERAGSEALTRRSEGAGSQRSLVEPTAGEVEPRAAGDERVAPEQPNTVVPVSPTLNLSEVESRLADRIRERGEVATAEYTDEGMRRVLGSAGGKLQDLVSLGIINKRDGRYSFNDNIVNQASEKSVLVPRTPVEAAKPDEIDKMLAELPKEAKQDWQMTQHEYRQTLPPSARAASNRYHEQAIKEALSQGKSVPANVISDYPDLKENVPRGRQTEEVQSKALPSAKGPNGAKAAGAETPAVAPGEQSGVRQGGAEAERTGRSSERADKSSKKEKASRPTDVNQTSPAFQEWWEGQGARGRDAIRAYLETGSSGQAIGAWKDAASGVKLDDKQIKAAVNNLIEETDRRLSREAGAVNFGEIYGTVSNLIQRARDQMTIDPVPGLKRLGVSTQARQHAAARVATPYVVRDILAKVFPDEYANPETMALTIDVINKDNILGGYDEFLRLAREASAAQDTDMAQRWQNLADAIGDKQDIARLEADVEGARQNPQIVANIERWKQVVNSELDRMYNEMKRVDPDTERESRGRVFGARVNLLPESRAAEMKGFADLSQPMPQGVSSSYRNPNVKKDKFMRLARFTGQYSTDAEAVLTNVIGPRLNEVTKLRFYDALTDSGATVELDYGEAPPDKIQGHKAARLPIKVPQTGEGGVTRMVEKVLYVRGDLVGEIRSVLGTDIPIPNSAMAKFLTTIQLAQLTDMTAHLKNIHTVLASAPATRSAFADALRRLPVVGTVDATARIINVTRDIVADTPESRAEQASMAKLGLIRPEYPLIGLQKITRGQQVIHHVDTASRIVMNRFFDDLVKAGRVTDTEENRASFVQQIGEYNRRLMGPIMRAMRDAGFAPFVVAGRNFNRQARRLLTGNPGVEASTLGESAKMRLVNILSGMVAASVLPALLNLLTTGSFGGRPGTPIGAWDLGKEEDERGRHRVIDLMQIVGIRRGLRGTGAGAVVEGLREGQTWDEIIGHAGQDIASTVMHPWMGPALGFSYQTVTGKRLDLRGGPEAPEALNVGGGGKQYLENARTALENQNPLLAGVLSPLIDPVESTEEAPKRSLLRLGIYAASPVTMLLDEGSYATRVRQGLVKGPTSAFGVYDLQSPAQKILSEDRRRRGAFSRTVSQVEARQVKDKLHEDERAGKNISTDLEQAVADGKLTMRQAHDFRSNSGMSPLALQIKYAPLNESTIRAFEAMDGKQKDETRMTMALKLESAKPDFFTDGMRARLEKNGFTVPDKIKTPRKVSESRRETQKARKETKAAKRWLPPEARPTPNPNRRYQVTPR